MTELAKITSPVFQKDMTVGYADSKFGTVQGIKKRIQFHFQIRPRDDIQVNINNSETNIIPSKFSMLKTLAANTFRLVYPLNRI